MGTITIRGVALEPHAETLGHSGVEKKWPAEEIADAAETLEGRPVTRSSDMSVGNHIGQVTEVEWDEERGLVYEAEIHDEEVAAKLEAGQCDAAPRLYHEALGTAEIDESDEPAVVTELEFDAIFMAPEVSDGVPGVFDVQRQED